MNKVKLSSKNQIVIPTIARNKLGIHGGDSLVIKKITATEIVLQKEPTYYDLVGVVPAKKEDAVKRIQKSRAEWQK